FLKLRGDLAPLFFLSNEQPLRNLTQLRAGPVGCLLGTLPFGHIQSDSQPARDEVVAIVQRRDVGPERASKELHVHVLVTFKLRIEMTFTYVQDWRIESNQVGERSADQLVRLDLQ